MLGIKRIKIKKSKSFLLKLFDILNNNTYNEIISWNYDGTSIIIKDINNLCDTILPKFYIHNNYKSFVRQLNIYGFHKIKNIKNEEGFKHEKFNKNSSYEQINQIMRKRKKMKFLLKYIKNDSLNKSKDNNKIILNNNLLNNSGNELLKYLLEKNKKNEEELIRLKEESGEIKNNNKNLNNELDIFKDNFKGQNIFIEKFIIQKKKENNNEKKIRKIKDIKELFKRYLYYLKIYTPFCYN